MKTRKILFIFILLLFFISKAKANDIEIESSNIEIDENGNIIYAFDAETIIKSENIKITSKKTQYNKKNEIIIFTGDVYFEDLLKNIIIQSNKVSYNKKKNLIFSSGPTNFNIEKKYEVFSKNVYFYRSDNFISSDEKTKITDYENNIYNLEDKFKFDINKEIIKSKKSVITDNNENKYIFEDLVINLKNNEIIGKEIKIDFKNDYFDNEKNDPILKGRSGYSNEENLKIYKAVFSTCNIQNKKCRGWELNSEEFNHDKTKKIFEYKNSWFKMFDYRVFFFPYFSHPDPTVKRKSGFLTPSYTSSDSLGFSINLPYFKVIDVDKDFTFSPRYYADKSFLLQNEYRQELRNSSILTDFSFLVGEAGTKGHLFYNQTGEFNKNTKYEFNLQSVRGDKYLKTYNLLDTSPIIKDDSVLLSDLYVNWNFDDSKLDLSFKMYEDLSRNDDRYQYIFPEYNFAKNINIPENYNGSFIFNSEGYNKNYNSNIFESVLINNFLFSSDDFINDRGVLTNFNILLKNSNSYADNSNNLPENGKYNLYEILKIDLGYPLQKQIGDYTNYLRPKASFIYSPNGNTDISTKNLTINYDNAFGLNRISEDTQVEGGQSLNLGFEFQKDRVSYNNKNLSEEIFKLRVGNIIKTKEDYKLPKKSKLNKTRSDIFGDINFKLNEAINLGYQFSYDRDLEYSNMDSINIEFEVNNLITNFNYYAEDHDFGDSENISNTTTYNFNDENRLAFKTTKNLKDDFTEYYKLVYEYLTDCLSFNLNYNKSFYKDGSLEPDESISFLIKIIPFTQLGVENVQNLIDK